MCSKSDRISELGRDWSEFDPREKEKGFDPVAIRIKKTGSRLNTDVIFISSSYFIFFYKFCRK